MWNRLTGFSPWVSGPPLFRAARSHPVPQVETRLGVRGRAKRSGRHGRCAGREVAKMCAIRRPEVRTPGHSPVGSRRRLGAKVCSPHLPADPAALGRTPSLPAGLCQVDLSGLLSTELVFGVSVYTAGPADPENEDAQWATHGGDAELRAEAGWEACLPRSAGLRHYLAARWQKGMPPRYQRRDSAPWRRHHPAANPAFPHRATQPSHRLLYILDRGGRALRTRREQGTERSLGAGPGKCGAKSGGLPTKKGRSVAWPEIS